MKRLPVADPGVPDASSASRYLFWVARTQAATMAVGVMFGVVWMTAQALAPAALGRAVDALTARDLGALGRWTAALGVLGLIHTAAGLMRHRYAVTNWLGAAYRTVQVTARQAARLGATLPKRVATGDVVGAIELRDVRYSYVDGRDVLHGVSLRLRPGERLAIVGPSGAGKSTLGRLLAGIAEPRTGAVTVGGVALSALPVDELRRHVALVTQEHHVFVGTVRDNVVLARPDAPAPAVRAALGAVDALEWALALPAGLDTVVGSGGYALSPAQAQQLALARLVLADPHTLVLDEATSSVDPRAARHLERSLAAVLRGRTVVAIAHRLFSAHDADRVAVVEDGRITELGSHHELIEAGGAYAALWRSWHGAAERVS